MNGKNLICGIPVFTLDYHERSPPLLNPLCLTEQPANARYDDMTFYQREVLFMGKLKPSFCNEATEEEAEQEQFKSEVEGSDFDKAVMVCRSPSDKRGHSKTVSFKCLPYYLRLSMEILTKEPRFRCQSDVHRTAFNLGYKEIIQALKANKKIGIECDDLILTIDELEREANADQAYRHLELVLKRIPKSLKLYKTDKKMFRKKLEKLQDRIESLSDPFWKNRLTEKLNQALRYDSGFSDDDLEWEEDREL